ncbi:hypothetical protein MTBUT4_230030 [Magnetospirillum sp. UT-4]|nr:hypothetical protein MTBUT4_230030 [Magnetospirillum sp. UT-4]
MLLNTDTGQVDHDDIAIVCLGGFLQEPIPDARLTPTDEPVVAGGRRAVAFGHFRPGRARAEAPKDAVQDPAVVDAGNATGLVREQGFNDRPFVFRQLVPPPRHRSPSCLRESLNHDTAREGGLLMRLYGHSYVSRRVRETAPKYGFDFRCNVAPRRPN